ncbi:MAG TPA: phospholipase D family protein [Ktedonobacteraceae bacterium]|nr:phospholipase D family protein [Ktedonobacteraceae bacterium]
MQANTEAGTEHQTWWAQKDTPVHMDSRVAYLIDGRQTMFTMALHYLQASKYIYIANWGITPSMELVRGIDRLAGDENSPERKALLEELHLAGLNEQDIAFWLGNDLSFKSVLNYAISKGVEVKVLLWDCPEAFSHYSPHSAANELLEAGIHCVLDNSSFNIQHPSESLHQKISIVDGTHGFVGGVDPLIENDGDYDRWDTTSHQFATPLRQNAEGHTPHPWHDVHCLIEGPAVQDVEHNFRQRWNDVVDRMHYDVKMIVPVHGEPAPLKSTSTIQIARTIPANTYQFDEAGIHGIAELYANALRNIKDFLYMENQYFWLQAFMGFNLPFGFASPDMEYNLQKIVEALHQGVKVAIVLPDHPNVGRALTDTSIQRIRDEAPEAVTEGRFHAYCLATCEQIEDTTHYRPIYVHAKIAIIDDCWSTAGSANLNNRGMRDDAELNIAVLDSHKAETLRMLLWSEHLGLYNEEEMFAVTRFLGRQHQVRREDVRARRIYSHMRKALGDPIKGLQMLNERAQDNLVRYKNKQPLIGHLLPYLTGAEATAEGFNYRETHGWLEEE